MSFFSKSKKSKSTKKSNNKKNNSIYIVFDKNNKEYQIIKKKLNGFNKYFISNPQTSINYLLYLNKKTKEVYVYTLPDNKNILEILYQKYNIPVRLTTSDSDKNKTAWAYVKLLNKYKYKKIYIGSTDGKSDLGDNLKLKNNGFLLEMNNHYIYIGDSGMYKIELDDVIEKILTPLGSPVIVGKKNIYHLEEGVGIERRLLPNKMNNAEIEDTWYGTFPKYQSFNVKTQELF